MRVGNTWRGFCVAWKWRWRGQCLTGKKYLTLEPRWASRVDSFNDYLSCCNKLENEKDFPTKQIGGKKILIWKMFWSSLKLGLFAIYRVGYLSLWICCPGATCLSRPSVLVNLNRFREAGLGVLWNVFSLTGVRHIRKVGRGGIWDTFPFYED